MAFDRGWILFSSIFPICISYFEGIHLGFSFSLIVDFVLVALINVSCLELFVWLEGSNLSFSLGYVWRLLFWFRARGVVVSCVKLFPFCFLGSGRVLI